MRKEFLMKLKKAGILSLSAAIVFSAASCGAKNEDNALKDKDTSVEKNEDNSSKDNDKKGDKEENKSVESENTDNNTTTDESDKAEKVSDDDNKSDNSKTDDSESSQDKNKTETDVKKDNSKEKDEKKSDKKDESDTSKKEDAGSDDFSYVVNKDNTITLDTYRGGDTNVVIPDKIDGKAVTALEGAFEGNNKIKSVVIPDSVTKIGDYTFCDCTNLKSISYSKDGKFEYIGMDAFENCAWFDSQADGVVYFANHAIGYKGEVPSNYKLTIKDGTEMLAAGSFYDADKITSVELPDSIKKIEKNCFDGCYNLENVKLSSSLESIDDSAFLNCEKIKSIKLPNTLRSIGESAFGGCTSLENVNTPSSLEYVGGRLFYNTPYWDAASEGIVYFGDFVIGYKGDMPKNYELNIKSTTKGIASFSFEHCTNITKVDIPKGVTYIGRYAFDHCENLKEVTIPDTVKSIEQEAFVDCTNLLEVTIPESVTNIGSMAFGVWWKDISGGNGDNFAEQVVPDFVVYGKKGSAAEEYVKNGAGSELHGLTFKSK